MPIAGSAAMKYILVTGGVISGVGKGIIASSIGVLLKYHGIRVSAIKIDPYLNVDAGTFSPYEHGEVFVLDDGGEVDLDLGNYERFLGIKLSRHNNITSGKIYETIIAKERRGDFLGKTVQVVPHVTDEIQNWVSRVAQVPVDGTDKKPEVCIIELGGTMGDIESMPYVEAFRMLASKVRRENFMNVHVALVVEPQSTGEQKTKPIQNSVRELGRCGLSADIIICRSTNPLQAVVRKKISDSSNVKLENVLSVPDVSSIYDVPLRLENEGALGLFCDQLNLQLPKKSMGLVKWAELAQRYTHLKDEVTIALVGKYVRFPDAYTSVIKALKHAAAACNKKLNLQLILSEDLEEESRKNHSNYRSAWEKLGTCDGVIVPGGFGERGVEGKIIAAKWARRNKKPFLGVCLGMQCAVIDAARELAGLANANSSEFDPNTPHPVIIDMPEHNAGIMGGTMRCGLRSTLFNRDNSILRKLYGNVSHIDERHRHRYEVNPEYVAALEAKGLKFVGHGDPERNEEDKNRMEIVELEDHPFYVGVQFHPEYISQPLKPSPPYIGLILASTGQLGAFIHEGRIPSPLTIINGLGQYSRDKGFSEKMHKSSPICIRKVQTQLHISSALSRGTAHYYYTNQHHAMAVNGRTFADDSSSNVGLSTSV